MNNILKRTTLQELHDKIDETILWLSNYEFRIAPTRIGLYKKALKKIMKSLPKDEMTGTDRVNYVTIAYEAQELVYIYEGLSSIVDEQLGKRLKVFVKGPFSYNDEKNSSSSNDARDVAFELFIASFFAQKNIQVDFGTNADLKFIFNGHTIYIECKRPQVKHQINSRIKDAYSQLDKRYKEDRNPDSCRGMMALSLSKCFNPKMDIARAKDLNNLKSYMNNTLNIFQEENERRWLA